MLAKFLRQFLFNLVHLVLTILVAIKSVHRRIWAKMLDDGFPKDQVTRSDIKLILDNVPMLRKKIHHLVMMSDTNHHSLSDLSLIVIWSLLVGVPYVSFYDVTGDLIANEEKLFLEVEKRKKGIPGFIKWPKMPDLNGYTNGNQSHTITVNIFNKRDGRHKIADCIRKIAENKLPYECKSGEFTAQELDSAISLVYPSIPDPSLVLYTGPLCCSHGLLPWQIRLSEFAQLSEDHKIDIENYLGALYKYNACDQRFGI